MGQLSRNHLSPPTMWVPDLVPSAFTKASLRALGELESQLVWCILLLCLGLHFVRISTQKSQLLNAVHSENQSALHSPRKQRGDVHTQAHIHETPLNHKPAEPYIVKWQSGPFILYILNSEQVPAMKGNSTSLKGFEKEVLPLVRKGVFLLDSLRGKGAVPPCSGRL